MLGVNIAVAAVTQPFHHTRKRRIEAWLSLLLLLAFFPFDSFAAQNSSSSFEEVAAEAAAARDVDDVPRAIELYTQALQLNPKSEESWWSLGLLQYGSGAYSAAIDAFSHLLTLNPASAQGLALRGLCEFETGDYPQSLVDIQKGVAAGAINDAHNEQILRYHEAMLLTRLGRFSEALKVYAPFAEHKLSSPELLLGIGLAGLRIPLLPKDASADQHALLTAVGEATFKFMQGDQTAAQQAFNDLFQRFPTAQNAHFHYGNLLLAFGPDAAAPQFKKGVGGYTRQFECAHHAGMVTAHAAPAGRSPALCKAHCARRTRTSCIATDTRTGTAGHRKRSWRHRTFRAGTEVAAELP